MGVSTSTGSASTDDVVTLALGGRDTKYILCLSVQFLIWSDYSSQRFSIQYPNCILSPVWFNLLNLNFVDVVRVMRLVMHKRTTHCLILNFWYILWWNLSLIKVHFFQFPRLFVYVYLTHFSVIVCNGKRWYICVNLPLLWQLAACCTIDRRNWAV